METDANVYFPHRPAPGAVGKVEPERLIWTGHTSQMVNAGYILGAVYGFWLLGIPLAIAIWKVLQVRCHQHQLTNHQIGETTGVLNSEINYIELARITDIQINCSWWQRPLGLGTVRLIATDKTHPTHYLKSIHDPKRVAQLILLETRKANPNQNVNIHT